MKRVVLVQIGYGVVGGAVIKQAVELQPVWRDQLGLDVRVGAVVGKGGTVLMESDTPLTAADLLKCCETRGAEGNPVFPRVGDFANADAVVFMDAAAGETTTDMLVEALNDGGGAVLSNKAPMALPMNDTRAQTLWSHAATGGHLKYEATCGAGLPVISTLRTLLDTGDDVIEIIGALSGTFGAIFSSVAEGMQFSDAVTQAKNNGYTEPDPRDDLSGLDVARKALILARTMGRAIDLEEIHVQSLVPEQLVECSIQEFLDGLDISNRDISDHAAHARQQNSALKYVASVTPGGDISVGLQAVPTSTVLGALQGPENVVSFRTRRYDAYPTVVSGPGAGADVTAAGMLGDALALARSM